MSSVREYQPNDRAACLEILARNTPRFFAESERAEFEAFLDSPPGPYLVVERDGTVVACGGWYHSDASTARLTWGMVDPDVHHQGLGRQLLRHRVDQAVSSGASVVSLSTTQLVSGFFAREGFSVVHVERGGFGEGLDRVDMEREIGGVSRSE